MALTQRLEIRQSHALVMTPQLMQAIKLLQLSNLDLATYVETELERNPLLERTGEGEGADPAAAAETGPERDGAAAGETGGADWQGDEASEPRAAAEDARDSPLDHGFDEADAVAPRAIAEMPPGYSEWSGTGSIRREDGDYNLEAFVSIEKTLTDHLAEQL